MENIELMFMNAKLWQMLNKVHTCKYTCNSLSGLGVLQNIPKKKNDIWKANVLREAEE